ncbi:MAG: hypothetical protein K8I65_13170 [Thermoanaerobaculia bacterium]|nr:hypothetical protein [Thermoanaerobaculia bacterium]
MRPRNGAAPGGKTGGGGKLASAPASLLRRTDLAKPCPLCGWPDGLLDLRAVGAGLGCIACFGDWPTEVELLAEAAERDAEAWRSLPGFVRTVLRDPAAERALRRVLGPLLRVGIDPEVVLLIARGVNRLRDQPIPDAEVEDLAVLVAGEVAAGGLRAAA